MQSTRVRSIGGVVLFSALCLCLASCGPGKPHPAPAPGTNSTARPAPANTATLPAAAKTEGAAPVLLFASTNGAESLDLRYLRELEQRGFAVAFTATLAELDARRLSEVDVVILSTTPAAEAAASGLASDPASEAGFVALVEGFVEGGGGLLLMPAETNLHKQRLAALYERWGARIPAETIVESDPARESSLPGASYALQLAFTNGIAAVGPLTSDVTGIWYPNHPAFLAGLSTPLIVDESWQVLVRGSPTSTTRAVDLSQNFDAAPDLVQRAAPVSEPALFAVRELGKGRVALTAIWPQFSIGAGTKLLYDRTVLEHGVRGIRSDFGKLLDNTLRWLAEPAERAGRSRVRPSSVSALTFPNEREQVRAEFRAKPAAYDKNALSQVPALPDQRVYQGLIGARTTGAAKADGVAEYAAAARRSGLDFVVFLEPFEQLSPEQLQRLNEECARLSGPDLLLMPGFSIRNNLGNRMFFFARSAAYPPAALLGGPEGRVFQVQIEKDGKYTGYATPFTEWVMRNYGRSALGQTGYFDFRGAPRGMRLPDARTYGGAGLRYYKEGRLIEDVTDDYLATAAGTMPPTPMAVHEVSSSESLHRASIDQRGLTYVVAENLDPADWRGVLQRGLRWSGQYDSSATFVSTGPRILSWPMTARIFYYGAEGFSPERALLQAQLSVSAEAGLAEVAIYDGPRLFRRIALHGERAYAQTLVLDGSLQRTLVLVVRDRRGGRAVSSPLRSWADGSLAPVFCGDRVNDCGRMRLSRGSWWLPVSNAPTVSTYESGDTWDGGPLAMVSALGRQYTLPLLTFRDGSAFAVERLLSVPVLELADDEAVSVQASRRGGTYAPELVQVINPWNTFGPVVRDSAVITNVQRYREWSQPRFGEVPFGFAANGVRRGASSSLFTDVIGFQRASELSALTLASFERVPGATLWVTDSAAGASQTYALSGREPKELRVEPGGAFAVYGTGVGALNAHVLINRGGPLRMRVADKLDILAELSGGRFEAGDTYRWELAGYAFPAGVVADADAVQSLLAYLESPTGLTSPRGTRVASPGLLELQVEEGVVEVLASRVSQPRILPLRVRGLNPRVSAILRQIEGYSPGFYGSGRERLRSLGVDPDGFAYVPLYVEQASVHVLAGHPIVVEGDDGQVFVQVTCLGGSPPRWHVSLNNPSLRSLTVRVRQAMDLPGLVFPERTLSLRAGELLVLQ